MISFFFYFHILRVDGRGHNDKHDTLSAEEMSCMVKKFSEDGTKYLPYI